MTEPGRLMAGKRGLVLGVANDRSLAWGIANAAHGQGAELAFTFQGDALKKRVEPLAEKLGSDFVLPCDVTDTASIDAVFAALADRWGRLDFLVHAIAFSDKDELKGQYIDTTPENFASTLN
ncbi:MAG: SDR family oxidoreductase, partial [Rhodospirillales bacterium]